MNRTKERNEVNQNYQRNYDNYRTVTKDDDFSQSSQSYDNRDSRQARNRNLDFSGNRFDNQDVRFQGDRGRSFQGERNRRNEFYNDRNPSRFDAGQPSRQRDYRFEDTRALSRNQFQERGNRDAIHSSPNRINVSARVEKDSFNDLPIGGAFDSFQSSGTMYNVRENTAVAPKKKISNKIKVFIAVYFVIIATITALILINAFPQNQSAGAEVDGGQEQVMNLTKEQALTIVTSEGAVVLNDESAVDYTYEKATNVFDKICDWIENLVG